MYKVRGTSCMTPSTVPPTVSGHVCICFFVYSDTTPQGFSAGLGAHVRRRAHWHARREVTNDGAWSSHHFTSSLRVEASLFPVIPILIPNTTNFPNPRCTYLCDMRHVRATAAYYVRTGAAGGSRAPSSSSSLA